MESIAKTMKSKNLFLSADERYAIWEVKREERPFLLNLESSLRQQEEDDGSDHLPLLDGCDIEGWRSHGMIETSAIDQGFLNVGSGCILMRRESQLPVLSTKSTNRWQQLRRRLLQPLTRTPERILEKDALQLPIFPWFERENVPGQ